LRPGGVRRVIELAVPYIPRAIGKSSTVVLAAGEPPDEKRPRDSRRRVAPALVELVIVPAFS